MEDSPERAYLELLEERLAAGEAEQVVDASLLVIAGQDVELDEDELRGAVRRAVQLLVTGGNPLRDLDVDGRAATALAADLDSPGPRASLVSGLASVRRLAEGLPGLSERLDRLAADEERSWRAFSCTLLAEELTEA